MLNLILKVLRSAFSWLSKNEMTTTTSFWLYEPEMPRSMRDE